MQSVLTRHAPALNLSGERFRVVYRILARDEEDLLERARGICLEQTVELPADLTPAGDIHDHIVGRIEQVELHSPGDGANVTISYAVETAGTGLPQLLNVVFGNTSMQPGIQVTRLELPDGWLTDFRGPRFGTPGLRRLLGVESRPLVGTALKPMGLPPPELAQLAYQIALGGIDVIKDDHGLANQSFCPFEERVERCAEAVARANRETGRNSIYVPNVTAPMDDIRRRALFAKRAGAGGLIVSFGLTGMDALRLLAEDEEIALPVVAHPALSGSFVVSPGSGIAHHVLYGQLMRLAGADAAIFVGYGGRFPYTRDQCRAVIHGCRDSMVHLKPIFPMPGGGMTLHRIGELRAFYGREVILLVAGGLYGHSADLVANARTYMDMVARAEVMAQDQEMSP
jgi:ribulose-bisphosphate carboxylase large chain